MITPKQITALRLHNQQLTQSLFSDPESLLRHMGALQAQHYGMVKWAVGLRLSGSTKEAVAVALNSGKLLRTHVLRPTWHLVAANELPVLLQLSASRILSAARGPWQRQGLNEEIFKKSFVLLKKVLKGGRCLPRTVLVDHLKKSGIPVEGGNRAAYILMAAELHRVLCSGPDEGQKNTYALYTDRVPDIRRLSREEALGRLAATYFKSRGPATVADFSWWSGLTLTEARKGIEVAAAQLQSDFGEGKTYWWAKGQPEVVSRPQALLLPAFDELLIAYRDRSLWLTADVRPEVIASNGMFWPVVLLDGKVTGLWKQTEKQSRLEITIAGFKRYTQKDKDQVVAAADALAHFADRPVELKFSRYTRN